ARSHRFFSAWSIGAGHAPAWLTHRRPLLWRGSLLPLGCAAAPGVGLRGGSGRLRSIGLGLLRSPAGASSLATGVCGGWVYSSCGSELARDGARSGTSMVAGVPLSRASSLPQVFSVPGPLVSGNPPAWLAHRRPLLWRGSLLPLGCAAAPGVGLCGGSDGLRSIGLGLLRSPAGASSLATGVVVAGASAGISSG
ncbi:hypothetical protein SAMN03159302_06077, partial [Pseudomonas sp. NFACC54]